MPCSYRHWIEALGHRVAVENLRTSVTTRIEQVTCISSFIMACYAKESRSKKRFCLDSEGSVDPLVVNFDRLSDRNARRIGRIVQRNVARWYRLSAYVEVCSTKQLVQPCVVSQRPWAIIKVFTNEGEKIFVGCDESALYTFETSFR